MLAYQSINIYMSEHMGKARGRFIGAGLGMYLGGATVAIAKLFGDKDYEMGLEAPLMLVGFLWVMVATFYRRS